MVELATVGVVLAGAGRAVVVLGETAGVVTAELVAGALGALVAEAGRFPDGGESGGSVALGFRDSTLVFSRFT